MNKIHKYEYIFHIFTKQDLGLNDYMKQITSAIDLEGTWVFMFFKHLKHFLYKLLHF